MLLSQSSGSSDQPGQVFTSGDLLHTPGKKLANYSIRMIKLQDIFIAVPIAAGIYLILMLFSLIAVLLFPEKSSLLSNPVNWSITNPAIIPLVFLTCLFTGYREELFFRSYFLTRFEMAGVSPIPAIAITTLLFSSGHVYQGLPGFIGTLFIGVYFGVLFYIRRNLHIIAIAHGLFNFANLIFTMV
jgi:membrane protease YdiL (CAAX protease family)